MKLFYHARAVICAVVLTVTAHGASVVMQALTSFGGGDGWLAPDEQGFTTTVASLTSTGATERSLAYSSVSNHLYVPTRGNGPVVMVLDANTGVQVGSLDMTGVSGGDLPINAVSASIDGRIYVGNVTSNASSRNFKLYRWADEASLPEVVYDGTPLASARVGDTLDVIGSGANTRFVAGYGSTSIGFTFIDPETMTATDVNVAGTVAGDFRLGITFAGDAVNVWGSQGGNGIRRAKTDGTLVGTMTQTEAFERPMDYLVLKGTPLLATVETGSTGATLDGSVRIYDMTDPASPVLLSTMKTMGPIFNTGGTSAAGTGSVAWGAINQAAGTATLYAMATNNGIQAFSIQIIPEPALSVMLVFGAIGLLLRRRRIPLALASVEDAG